eukprot:12330839-Karenia_brevis.AAC.1
MSWVPTDTEGIRISIIRNGQRVTVIPYMRIVADASIAADPEETREAELVLAEHFMDDVENQLIFDDYDTIAAEIDDNAYLEDSGFVLGTHPSGAYRDNKTTHTSTPTASCCT